MDLISEGNIGLVMATKRFDVTKGFKFISYAVWWIRKLILMAIAEQGRLVRLPASKIREISHLISAMDILEQELERSPTIEELGNHLDITPDSIRDLMAIRARRISLHAPREAGEGLKGAFPIFI